MIKQTKTFYKKSVKALCASKTVPYTFKATSIKAWLGQSSVEELMGTNGHKILQNLIESLPKRVEVIKGSRDEGRRKIPITNNGFGMGCPHMPIVHFGKPSIDHHARMVQRVLFGTTASRPF